MTQMKFTQTLRRAMLVTPLVLGLAPALSACGGGDGGNDGAKAEAGATATKADATAAKGEAKAVDPAVQKEAEEALSAVKLDPKVEKAVNIAREIDADPSKAQDVLAKYKINRDDLDALMYEISRDPALAKSYAAARERS